MPSLIDLRRRVRAVTNTQQITKAMKMVAAAKLRRAQEAVVQSRAYVEKLAGVVAGLASEASLREHTLVRERSPEGRVMLIVLTSDRGLCGGFNTNLIRQAEKFLATPERTAVLGTIGHPGRSDVMAAIGPGGDDVLRQLVAIVGKATDAGLIEIPSQHVVGGYDCVDVDVRYAPVDTEAAHSNVIGVFA